MTQFNPIKLVIKKPYFHFAIIVAITLLITAIYYIWYDQYEWFWWFSIYEAKNDIIGSIYYIPFLYTSMVFRWRGSLAIWLLSLALIMPRIIYLSFSPVEIVRNLFVLTVPLMVVAIITLQLGWRERQKLLLAKQEEERKHYMSQILKAQEDERHRLARELHDDTLQGLLAIANRAQAVLDADGNDHMNRNIEWIRDSIIQITGDLRRLCLDLRPSILDNLGLVPALRWLVVRLSQDDGRETKLVVKGTPKKLDSGIEVTIFRIIQEAINNIRRHSNASRVLLTLQYFPKHLEITVKDNGIGFTPSKIMKSLVASNKMGIIGMQQRAQLIGGSVDVKSSQGKGTSVSIRIPHPMNSSAAE